MTKKKLAFAATSVALVTATAVRAGSGFAGTAATATVPEPASAESAKISHETPSPGYVTAAVGDSFSPLQLEDPTCAQTSFPFASHQLDLTDAADDMMQMPDMAMQDDVCLPASYYACKLGLPHIYISSDSGAPTFKVAWNDEARLAQGIDHLYLDEGDPTAPEGGAMNDTIAQAGGDGSTWVPNFFDTGSYQEYLSDWGKTIAVGRTRIGGIDMGVIYVETCLSKQVAHDFADLHDRSGRMMAQGEATYPMQPPPPPPPVVEEPGPSYWEKPPCRKGTLKNVVTSSQLGVATGLFGAMSFLVLGPKGFMIVSVLYLAGALPTSTAGASSSSGHDDCECEGDTTDHITWFVFDWCCRILTAVGAVQTIKKNCISMLEARADRRRAEEEANQRHIEEEESASSEGNRAAWGGRGGSPGSFTPRPHSSTPRTSWVSTFEAAFDGVNAVCGR